MASANFTALTGYVATGSVKFDGAQSFKVRPGPGPELILGAGAYHLDLTTGRFVKIISSTVVMTL